MTKNSLISLLSLALIITLIIAYPPATKLINLRKHVETDWLILDEHWPKEQDITILSSTDVANWELDYLIQSIREMNPSVLAINLCGSTVNSSDSLVLKWMNQGVIVTNCEGVPLVSSYIISDSVIKKFSTINPKNSFELVILRNYAPEALNTLLNRKREDELINFRTASQYFKELDYESFQRGLFSKKAIESKIVLIGHLEPNVMDFGQETDSINSFRTPVHRSLYPPDQNKMFGIEISANIIQMTLNSNFLNEFPIIPFYAIIAVVLIVCALILFRIPLIPYWLTAFLLYFLLIFGELYLTSFLLSKQNLLIDPFPYQLPFILITVGIFIYKVIKAKRI
ncbi:MAG: CHASE2 domain-containing protein [Marinoscillum sp.]